MRTSRLLLTFAGLSLTAAVTLTGCGNSPEDGNGAAGAKYAVAKDVDFPAGSTMKALHDKGKIRIGVKYDSPGFAMKNPATGKSTGLDIDLATYIAAKLGIPESKIEWVEATAANKELFIQNGNVDMVVAEYAITDERKKVVSFAGPYLLGGQTLMVSKSNTTITGPKTVKGKKVCSTKNSVSLEVIKAYKPVLVPFENFSECVDQLAAGQVDAVTGDLWIMAGYAASKPDKFKLVGDTFTKVKYGIGLKKDDKVFRDWITDQISAAIADGTWKKAIDAGLGKAGAGEPIVPAPEKY